MEGLDIISMEETLITELSETIEGSTLESEAEYGIESVSESDTEFEKEIMKQGEIEVVVAENESAQSTETLIDYSDTLSLIYSEIQTVNYLMTVMVFLQLFIWLENKVNHIVRSVSNKWKI